MKKVLLLLLVVTLFYAGMNGLKKVENLPKRSTDDLDLDQKMLVEGLVENAKAILTQKIEDEEDISNGPCLADPFESNPDWVADVAHEPGIPADSDPENQCQSYLQDQAKHFIELDEKGNLIRFK